MSVAVMRNSVGARRYELPVANGFVGGDTGAVGRQVVAGGRNNVIVPICTSSRESDFAALPGRRRRDVATTSA